MLTSAIHTVTLARHPDSRGTAVRAIEARVSREPEGRLAVWYWVEGDVARLYVPPPRPARCTEGLWQHTCCECFLRLPCEPGYHEFNFSPSGEWAAYAFAKYRDGRLLADEALNPCITARSGDGGFELDVSIPLARLSTAHAHGALSLALSAVIEERDGALSYWALAHAPGRPDFHHADAFVMELE